MFAAELCCATSDLARHCGWPTFFVRRHNCLISFFHDLFLHLGDFFLFIFFIKNTTVFFLFSKGAKQTSLQSERSLILLFPQETCFPSFKKPLLASPCCWASQSCFRGASNGGRGWECLGLVWGVTGLQLPYFLKRQLPQNGKNCRSFTWVMQRRPRVLETLLSAGAISISPGALLHTCSYCS